VTQVNQEILVYQEIKDREDIEDQQVQTELE